MKILYINADSQTLARMKKLGANVSSVISANGALALLESGQKPAVIMISGTANHLATLSRLRGHGVPIVLHLPKMKDKHPELYGFPAGPDDFQFITLSEKQLKARLLELT